MASACATARGFVFALLLLLPSAGPAAALVQCYEGRIEIDSDPGDLIGHGESLRFDRSDADPLFGFFAIAEGVERDGVPTRVRILFRGAGHSWSFAFSSHRLEGGLVPGDYPGATRYPFEGPGEPGLSISGNHRAWGQLRGSFRVLEASYAKQWPFPAIRRFAAEFVQSGHDFPEALWGRVECFYTLLVPVDVRPGSDEITLNLSSAGLLPVALLGAENFDIDDLDRSTLGFGPGRAAPVHRSGGHPGDVDGDGREDWLVHLRVADLGVALGERELCVDGALVDGRPLEGCDGIRTTFGYGVTAIALEASFPGRGWFDSDGQHIATNDNTFTGSNGFRDMNSFFVWDVSGLTGMRVVSATLRFGKDYYTSREASETIEVHAVSHSRDALVAGTDTGDPEGIAIHEDLETGVLYGSFEVARASEVSELALPESALSEIQAAIDGSGYFAVGLHNATDDRDGREDGVRFDLPRGTQQLLVELRPAGSPRP